MINNINQLKKEDHNEINTDSKIIKTNKHKSSSTLSKELNIENNNKEKNNFLMAINSIKYNNLYTTKNTSEFSKTTNKEEQMKYINETIKSNFSKKGNLKKNILKQNSNHINIPSEIKMVIQINKKNIQNEKNKNLEDIINLNLKYRKENIIKTPNLLFSKIKIDSTKTKKDYILYQVNNNNNLYETPKDHNQSSLSIKDFSVIKKGLFKYYTPISSNNKKSFFLLNQKEEDDIYKDNFYNHLSMKSFVFREKNRSAQHFYFYSSPTIHKKNNLFDISNHNKSNKLDISSNFQKENHLIFDHTFLNNLYQKEEEYQNEINNNYIYNFNYINSKIRAQVFCLICSICENFGYKRDTYYLTLYNIDRYCSKINEEKNLSKENFTLIAITSLEISAKIEEIKIIKLEEYIKLINNLNEKTEVKKLNIKQIIALEKIMMITFKWKNNPNTLNLWLNWHIYQWDAFIESIEENYNKLYLAYGDNIVFFNKKNNQSYKNYRKITQIIDLIILDYNSLAYEKQYLVIGAIFIILQFNYKKNKNNTYLSIFEDFIKGSFGDDIVDDNNFNSTMKYVNKICKNFIQNNLFSYELPIFYQFEHEDDKNYSYEEFISFQIYNEKLLDYSCMNFNYENI